MIIGCPGSIVGEQLDCFPTCTRWKKVNTGEPIRVYVDDTNYDVVSMVYLPGRDTMGLDGCIPLSPGMEAMPAQQKVQLALDAWNKAYTCGTLFTQITDPAQADVIIRYTNLTFPVNGVVNQILQPDNSTIEDCPDQRDHGDLLGPGTANGAHDLRLRETLFAWQSMIDTTLHELGHVLGMGHVSTGTQTIMGTVAGSRPNEGHLYAYDIVQLNGRYPCGCNVIETFNLGTVAGQVGDTVCPCCEETR